MQQNKVPMWEFSYSLRQGLPAVSVSTTRDANPNCDRVELADLLSGACGTLYESPESAERAA